jgi:hypothetical protein
LLCFALLCQHPKFYFSSKLLPGYQKFTETRTKYSVSNENTIYFLETNHDRTNCKTRYTMADAAAAAAAAP